ncbi:MAG: phospholipase D-like domain-containing protein [Brevinematales bacterium]|nr:phospholipase D-like domain-containing protein [Brevinematales bacterium]
MSLVRIVLVLVCLMYCFNGFCEVVAFFNSPEFGENLKNMIVLYINLSQSNISMSAYSFDDMDIANALINASRRGVKIRIMVDSDYWNDIVGLLDSQPNINVFNDLKSKGYKQNSRQHHSKFIVIDYDVSTSPVKNTVITGSFNFTLSASKLQYNNVVIVSNNIDIANVYIQEFNEEWGGNDFEFNPIASRIGRQKTDPPPYFHQSGDIEVYFSYSDRNKIKDRIKNLLLESTNIYICAYSSSTNSELFNVIYEMLDSKSIYGVFDGGHAFHPYSAFLFLYSKKPDNFTIDYEYKVLHNKYIILNYTEDAPENAIIVTGSYNISKNAEENNEENVIVIRNNPVIARKYFRDFLYHFTRSGKNIQDILLPSFFKTNLTVPLNSTNTIYGRNLHKVLSLVVSNDTGVATLSIISNFTNGITFAVPNISGSFNLVSIMQGNMSEITPTKLSLFSQDEPLLIINDGSKVIKADEPVNVRLYTFLTLPYSSIDIKLEGKSFSVPLVRNKDHYSTTFYLDTLINRFSNDMPIMFCYSNLCLTNYIVLPAFSYKLRKPDKVYKNSFHSIKFDILSSFGRNLKISVDGNVSTTVHSDGTVSFFTGNKSEIRLFFTIEDELGNSYSDVVEFTVYEISDIFVYPTIVSKDEKIFVEGNFEKIQVLDKHYNLVPFSIGEDLDGRRYIILMPYKVPSLAFIIFYNQGNKVIRKVVVK